jgi:hypothetical protein
VRGNFFRKREDEREEEGGGRIKLCHSADCIKK